VGHDRFGKGREEGRERRGRSKEREREREEEKVKKKSKPWPERMLGHGECKGDGTPRSEDDGAGGQRQARNGDTRVFRTPSDINCASSPLSLFPLAENEIYFIGLCVSDQMEK